MASMQIVYVGTIALRGLSKREIVLFDGVSFSTSCDSRAAELPIHGWLAETFTRYLYAARHVVLCTFTLTAVA